MGTHTKTISAAEFDRRFDAGEDVSAYIDLHSAKPLSNQAKGDTPKLTLHSAKAPEPKKPSQKIA